MSEETDVNKTDGLRECSIYHYWYFLVINSRFQPEVRDGCHHLMLPLFPLKEFV